MDALTIQSEAPSSVPFAINSAGNIGIGTTSPGAALEVNGSIKLTSGSSGSITFQDGTTQSTAFIPANCGADFAEAVDVTGDRAKYNPGDLLVIAPDAPGKFLKSNQAYSTLIAGIYSTKPGFVGRKQPPTPESNATEVPMAMVGRVPTKVSAENGAIKVGDLLVSSSAPGYAMKGTDRSKMLGAVIGKALGSLESGTGTTCLFPPALEARSRRARHSKAQIQWAAIIPPTHSSRERTPRKQIRSAVRPRRK